MQKALKDIRDEISELWLSIGACRLALEQLAGMFQAYCQLHDAEHTENQQSFREELEALTRTFAHLEERVEDRINFVYAKMDTLQK